MSKKQIQWGVRLVEYDGKPWTHTDGWIRDSIEGTVCAKFKEYSRALELADEYRKRNPLAHYRVEEANDVPDLE